MFAQIDCSISLSVFGILLMLGIAVWTIWSDVTLLESQTKIITDDIADLKSIVRHMMLSSVLIKSDDDLEALDFDSDLQTEFLADPAHLMKVK